MDGLSIIHRSFAAGEREAESHYAIYLKYHTEILQEN